MRLESRSLLCVLALVATASLFRAGCQLQGKSGIGRRNLYLRSIQKRRRHLLGSQQNGIAANQRQLGGL